jgi:pimeloyl-ACP methyl ester carboxylesterase
VTTFALVHGAWHDAWCWNQLTPELRSLGHDVVAMDLPCDDTTATFETYADVVTRAVEDRDDDVVVVGHSLGGYTIPLVAAQRPVRRLVFLCALIPTPGRSLGDELADDPPMLVPGYLDGLSISEGATRWVDDDLARDLLYADCSDDDARDAVSHLRPQAVTHYGHPFPLENMPDVERAYVVCSEDRIVDPGWSRANAPGRLGVEPIELPGSHSPFLSRPKELARLLNALA